MCESKQKILRFMREEATEQEKMMGGKYAYKIPTWLLRLRMEKIYPDESWSCVELRKILGELANAGAVIKCPYESRRGQAVWRLVENQS